MEGIILKAYRIVSVKTTKEFYGLGMGMKDMIGDIVKLSPPTETKKSFNYRGYTWRYEDVVEVDDTPCYPAPEYFHPSNLMGVSNEKRT
jgi:hypothetical protein